MTKFPFLYASTQEDKEENPVIAPCDTLADEKKEKMLSEIFSEIQKIIARY